MTIDSLEHRGRRFHVSWWLKLALASRSHKIPPAPETNVEKWRTNVLAAAVLYWHWVESIRTVVTCLLFVPYPLPSYPLSPLRKTPSELQSGYIVRALDAVQTSHWQQRQAGYVENQYRLHYVACFYSLTCMRFSSNIGPEIRLCR